MFPENLDTLHAHEEDIRQQCRAIIAADEELLMHVDLIERSMTLIHQLSRNADHRDDDDLVIRRLGFRMFNSTSAALNAVLAGYNQISVMIMRDLLEIHFLMDFFSIDKTMIGVWAKGEEKDLRRIFQPAAIRTALDDRDGFTTRRREAHYKELCRMGAHATAEGFRLLEPELDGISQLGPFFSRTALDACISELAKIIGNAAGEFPMWINWVSKEDIAVQLSFVEAREAWMCRWFGKAPDSRLANHLLDLLAQVSRAEEDRSKG